MNSVSVEKLFSLKFSLADSISCAEESTKVTLEAAWRPGTRPFDLGHRPCDRSEMGVRSALRRDAFHQVLSKQAADDSGCSRQYAMDGAGYSGPGNAGGRARCRRAAGWRWVCLRLERPLGCAGGRDFPARSCERRHDSDVARSGPTDAACADGAYLMEV